MASFADIHLEPGLARGLKRGDRRAQAIAYRVLAPCRRLSDRLSIELRNS